MPVSTLAARQTDVGVSRQTRDDQGHRCCRLNRTCACTVRGSGNSEHAAGRARNAVRELASDAGFAKLGCKSESRGADLIAVGAARLETPRGSHAASSSGSRVAETKKLLGQRRWWLRGARSPRAPRPQLGGKPAGQAKTWSPRIKAEAEFSGRRLV